MSSPAGRQGIERLLKWAPSGTVNTNIVELADDWDAVLRALAAGAADPPRKCDVVIAELRLPGSPPARAFHAADPTASMIDIDLERGTSNTPMFDVGSEKLRRLAEWLAREAGLTAASAEPGEPGEDEAPGEEEAEERPTLEAPPPKLALDAAKPGPALLAPSRPRPVPPPPCAAPDAQLADLLLWLELKLSLMLAEAGAEVPQQEFPGWALSAARARALLGAEFAYLPAEELLRLWRDVDARLESHASGSATEVGFCSVGRICRAFALGAIERQIFWLAAAPALSGHLARVIGYLNDDLGQCRPTLSLVAQMVDGGGPLWRIQRSLGGDKPFGHFRVVTMARPDPLAPESLAPLVAAPDLLKMLIGGRTETAVEGATLFDPARFGDETFDLQVAPVLRAARTAADRKASPVIHFNAPAHEAGWLAAQLASVGEFAMVGDVAPLAGASFAEIHDRLLAFGRVARLFDSVLIVSGFDEHSEPRSAELAQTLARDIAPHVKLLAVQGMKTAPTELRAAGGGIMEISRPRPSREERETIWMRAAASRGLALSEQESRGIAATFAFDRAQAETTIALALGSGAVEPPEASEAALREVARVVSRAAAPASVRRIETGLGWDDLILPAPIKGQLKSIVARVRHATTVWEDWGFGDRIPYGQAMIALLAGPSGTGKTMAAQIIAGELGAALFQVDLAKTVSKYIGETEKAIDKMFTAAEAASAVLLIDEADALLGKRSDIQDAHDRYANIEVNYLLQRMEEHVAPVLLTTNRKGNLDAAFLRRLTVVDFPMPNEEQRELIWKHMLPPKAPVADDVDPTAFKQLPLSGGDIRNSIVAAAFLAAEEGGRIRMRHLVAAARGELAKSGRESAGRILTHLIDGDRAAGGER